MRKIMPFVLAALAVSALPHAARAVVTCNGTLVGGLLTGYVGVYATSLAFGSYSAASPSAQQSNVVITAYCYGGLLGYTASLPPFTMALSAGGGTMTQRNMFSGGNTLHYQIYTSAVLSTVWGDGSGGSSTVAGGNDGLTTENLTGYGVIPAGQYVTPGSYGDTITVTLTY